MRAAVYRGSSVVTVDEVHTPEIGTGEILIRVEACGVCHTDLKKIEYNLLAPPRIFGHETAGIVAAVGSAVAHYRPGDRVIVFHHIPCGSCFYCERKLYAQCPVYKKVGVTAGFEPAGGGFAQYVRVMDWIVERGVEKIPDGVPFEVAAFVEPVNTCLKAVEQCHPQPNDVVLVQGQGPIGLIFTMLLKLRGCTILTTDTIPTRLALSKDCGASYALDPRTEDVAARLRDAGRTWYLSPPPPKDWLRKPSAALGRERKLCFLRKRPIKNESNFRAPAFASESGYYWVHTALQ